MSGLGLQGDPMTHSKADVGVDPCQVLVESYAVNERMNQIVLEHLDPAAWRAKVPGSKGRTIAAIVAHVHNIRRKWLRLSAPHLKLPAPLDRASCTQKQARAALVESAVRCSEMLTDALSRPQSRVSILLAPAWVRKGCGIAPSSASSPMSTWTSFRGLTTPKPSSLHRWVPQRQTPSPSTAPPGPRRCTCLAASCLWPSAVTGKTHALRPG